MPELPEVHTITTQLGKSISDYKVVKVISLSKYNIYPNMDIFLANSINHKVIGTERMAKNILLHLDNGDKIVFHLAMTGQIFVRDTDEKVNKWVKVIIKLTKGKAIKYLQFSDMRTFGKIRLIKNHDYASLNEKYGFDPFSNNFTPTILGKELKKRRGNIKNVLMNQSVISGLGNIYATESLFLSKINPMRSTNTLTTQEIQNLLISIKTVLKDGIKHKGSTLKDKMFVDIFGKPGKYQNYFKVYSKTTCPECRNTIKVVKISGRSTYFCPKCQV